MLLLELKLRIRDFPKSDTELATDTETKTLKTKILALGLNSIGLPVKSVLNRMIQWPIRKPKSKPKRLEYAHFLSKCR